MLCENCKKNIANTYFKQTVNGQTREIFLCSECAAKLGLSPASNQDMSFGLADLFNEFFGTANGLWQGNALTSGTQSRTKDSAVCPFCNMTEEEFFTTGKAGCEKCYPTFRARLQPLLNKLHGNKKHIGKTPLSAGGTKDKNDISSLKKNLADAVKNEDFEQAAMLRDKIKEIEARNNG